MIKNINTFTRHHQVVFEQSYHIYKILNDDNFKLINMHAKELLSAIKFALAEINSLFAALRLS